MSRAWVPPALLEGIAQATWILPDLVQIIGEYTRFQCDWSCEIQRSTGLSSIPMYEWATWTLTVADLVPRWATVYMGLCLDVRVQTWYPRFCYHVTCGDQICMYVDFTATPGTLKLRINEYPNDDMICNNMDPTQHWFPYYIFPHYWDYDTLECHME